MTNTLRALEFYSGIGGLHYASVLFNHLAAHQKIYNKEYQATGNGKYSDVILPHPDVIWSKSGPTHENKDETYAIEKSKRIAMNDNTTSATSTTSTTLTTTNLPFIQVVESFEINSLANDVYEYNFGKRPREGLIDRLTVEQVEVYKADIWLMSPPCQPYTRGGLQKDENDARASSFHHLLLTILPSLTKQPKYILLENVQCFESSQSCSFALAQLRSRGYKCEQYLLSPRQFGIPNQRSRFFLLATLQTEAEGNKDVGSDVDIINFHLPQNVHFKHIQQATEEEKATWMNPDEKFSRILCTLPPPQQQNHTEEEKTEGITTKTSLKGGNEDEENNTSNTLNTSKTKIAKQPILIPTKLKPEEYIPSVYPSKLSNYLVDTINLSQHRSTQDERVLSEDLLSKPSSWCIDIVDRESLSTSCFTKAYTTFLRGSGSILQTRVQNTSAKATTVQDALEYLENTQIGTEIDKDTIIYGEDKDEFCTPLIERGLRYFDSREVSNLHFFPPAYITNPLPNSINRATTEDKSPETDAITTPKRLIEHSISEDIDTVHDIDIHPLQLSKKQKKNKGKLSKAERILARQTNNLAATKDKSLYNTPEAFGDNYMCFSFPSHITFKQKHKMLGNSLNVYVVSQLLMRMLQDEF